MLTVIDRLMARLRPSQPAQVPLVPAPLPTVPRQRRAAEKFACASCGRITAHTASGVPYLHRCFTQLSAVLHEAGDATAALPLFNEPGTAPQFSGYTFSPSQDGARLAHLLERVFALMQDGRWRTLAQIAQACGGSEASVSARLRDFRKAQFGAHVVRHRRMSSGLWTYQLVPAGPLLGVKGH